MSNLIHEDAKKADAVTAQLKRGFEWTTSHSQWAISLGLGLVVILAAIFGFRSWSLHKEQGLQADLFKIESEYLKKKEAFDQAGNPTPETTTSAAPSVKASGDLTKDYGDLAERFKSFAEQNKGSVAGAMAAMYASELYANHGQIDAALATLKSQSGGKGLTHSLLQNRLASLLANNKDCKSALGVWQGLLPNAGFMTSEVKLRMALCAEETGDSTQAEKLLQEVIAQSKDSSSGKTAEQLLRWMKVKSL